MNRPILPTPHYTTVFTLTTLASPADNHDIISIAAKNLYSTKSTKNANSGNPRPMSGQSSASGGWGWFFVKFILFGGVCAGGYFGFVAYRAQQKRSSRF